MQLYYSNDTPHAPCFRLLLRKFNCTFLSRWRIAFAAATLDFDESNRAVVIQLKGCGFLGHIYYCGSFPSTRHNIRVSPRIVRVKIFLAELQFFRVLPFSPSGLSASSLVYFFMENQSVFFFLIYHFG